ncbi:MAG: ATP-binding protein [Verrucomicrobiae bacterium]|nr:ATP-binding protein [Verrucomicrobiae bacterium]
MNPDPSLHIENLKQLIEKLRETVSSFVERETALEREHNLQLHRERESWEQQVESRRAQLENALEKADEADTERRDGFSERMKRRREWIDRAHLSAKNHAARALAQREGHRVYQMQMSMIQKKRDLAGTRDRIHQEREVQLAELAQDRESIAKLRKAAGRAVRGYGSFRRTLATSSTTPPEESVTVSAYGLLNRAREERAAAGEILKQFRRLALPRMFASLPVSLAVILIALVAGGLAFGLPAAGFEKSVAYGIGGTVGIAGILLIIILYFGGKSQGTELVSQLAASLQSSREALERSEKQATADFEAKLAKLEGDAEETTSKFDEARKQSPEQIATARVEHEKKLEIQHARLKAKFDAVKISREATLEASSQSNSLRLKTDAEAGIAELNTAHEVAETKLKHAYEFRWEELETEWRAAIAPIYAQIDQVRETAASLFPDWDREFLDRWQAPKDFAHAAQFGHLEVEVAKLAGDLPKSDRLSLPGPANFALPVSLLMPERGSVLFESDGGGRETMIASLNQLILRLLSVAPAAKLSFTILDPVGLGEGFSGLMHLADYDESLINSRIWTQSQQIEARLGDLNDHIEKVIQMYLRNEFASITEYNRQAGKIAEKYHFVVIADFPANFSELAAKRLTSIAASGARCGVYLLMHWDRKKTAPQDFDPEQVRNHALRIVGKKGGKLLIDDEPIPGAEFSLDRLSTDEALINDFIHKFGAATRDADRVEVPFSDIAPTDDEMWSVETTKELRVPIGRTGATKRQYLAIGRDTKQHALIAGKTGSGKSTLFHVMITNLSLWCSPDEVEFYLVDFKKGVEFKSYANARLPHARVIAIESDREFGLSVLQRLDEELKRRGDLFRKLGVQDLPGYEKAGGTETIPRTLLLIDEFQEFFVEDDRIAQNANVLLDRIVRQGRAFGIHVILGSQTLGGAYTLARTTLGQMVIRIALQCNEADAYLIMDDTNPAPRLLTRPGEGIYNDQAGMVEGNNPFQVVWLSEEERDGYLRKVSEKAAASDREYAAPIVFEGNAPAEIRENVPLRKTLAAFPAEKLPTEAHLWLGAPNAIKGPTQAVFQRQSGNHLLIIGQRDEASLTMLTVGMTALSAQFPREGVRFVLLDSSAPETPEREHLEMVAECLPQSVSVVRGSDIDTAMNELGAELSARQGDESASAKAPSVFVLVNGLQRLKKLRYEEDFSFSLDDDAGGDNPGTVLNNLITEGPAVGMHVIATCDTYNNLNRALSRKALSEFEMRVLFQMSANDSASLIDTPKASGLGLHRALFYNEQEGYLETFRPYAQPDDAWFEGAFGPTKGKFLIAQEGE